MASRFWVGGNGTWSVGDTTKWSATSGGGSGASVPGAGDTVTIDQVGSVVALNYAPTVGAVTLTNGTLNLAGNVLTCTTFSSSNSNTRAITAGGGGITLTGNAATIWDTGTATNLTLNDALTVTCSYSGAAGSRTVNAKGNEANSPSVAVTAGTDTVVFLNGTSYKNVDYTGFSGHINEDNNFTVYGNFTQSATMVRSGVNVGGTITFGATSGTKVITTNGVGTGNVSFNGAGGTFQLADNLTVGATPATPTATLTAGTLDLNTKTLSTGRFNTSGSTARTIKDAAGTGKIATTDTTAATVFDATTTTNLTVDRTNAWTIEIGGNTTNVRTANLGSGKSWPKLTFTNTTANGGLDLVCSSTTTVLKALAYTGGTAQTIRRTASTTITIEDDNGFPSGTAGNVITIGSITAASHTWAKSGGGVVGCDYLSISRSTATPGTTWYAGPLAHSTDGGNNSGWTFTAAPAHYTFTVAYGAFALTGENAGLLAARTLPAGQGAFAMTGEPAGLTAARKLSVANGSFTLTGEDAGLLLGHRLTAGQGAFTFAGESVGLYHGRLLTAGQGAFTLTGEDVAFSRTYRLPAGQGSFTLTGESIGLRAARLISPSTGYFFLNRLMHHDPSKPLSAHGAGTGLTPHAAGSSIKRHV